MLRPYASCFTSSQGSFIADAIIATFILLIRKLGSELSNLPVVQLSNLVGPGLHIRTHTDWQRMSQNFRAVAFNHCL